MKSRNIVSILAIIFFIYFFSVIGSSCAQIGMPIGGPRDSLPPVLLASNPPNGSLHFNEKVIYLTFNEYVELKNLQENLIVSPTPIINPVINSKLRQVKITLRDTLQPNTTYSLQLGNSIQDINENNPYKDFNYVFSTGDYIDSLKFRGTVHLAETGKSDSTLIALLYSDLSDSAVYKKKPKYISRLDSSGNFSFRNLAYGTYHLFAIKDESGQRMYTDPTQLFAFSDSAVIINQDTKSRQIFAYQQEKEVPKATGNKTDKKTPLKFTTSMNGNIQDLLSGLTLDFNKPLRSFDSLKIKLTDTLFNAQPFTISFTDTTNSKIKIQPTWKEESFYKLILDSNFVKDTTGQSLVKNDTLSFKTKKETDYGSLKLNFKNLDKFKHPVLQFLSNNLIVNAYPLSSSTFQLKLIAPGEYTLRMLEDTNQNGKWDPGDYLNKKQPELVRSIDKKLTIRANWDNETDLEL
ncbi:MAG: Ig-like domain-containing domain [Ginsengibacter sp.]